MGQNAVGGAGGIGAAAAAGAIEDVGAGGAVRAVGSVHNQPQRRRIAEGVLLLLGDRETRGTRLSPLLVLLGVQVVAEHLGETEVDEAHVPRVIQHDVG